jgi:hypothetical protein
MKIIYCYKCGIKVGEIAVGSKLKKGLVYICPKCLIPKSKPTDYNFPPGWSDIFGLK